MSQAGQRDGAWCGTEAGQRDGVGVPGGTENGLVRDKGTGLVSQAGQRTGLVWDKGTGLLSQAEQRDGADARQRDGASAPGGTKGRCDRIRGFSVQKLRLYMSFP